MKKKWGKETSLKKKAIKNEMRIAIPVATKLEMAIHYLETGDPFKSL